MTEASEDRSAVLFDFVELLLGDQQAGKPAPLASYLARFPGHEAAIAREYLRFVDSERPAEPDEEQEEPLDGASRAGARYAVGDEIARGGMGAVHRVRDQELDRELAMKVMLGHGARALERFLEEARITGRLDHPGVVPLHDLGIDSKGRTFFTMRLVRGRDLKDVFALVHGGAPEWSLKRALDVLLKVCDAMAFAHSRGVIHRDLKPANVRVGDFGEVYVMDWGLARDLGRADAHDMRLQAEAESADEATGSPLVTMDGEVLGTPAYMAPEQAEGRLGEVGPRSDVYSVGAMLYHLLTGQRPYGTRTESTPRAVLAALRAGAPEPVQRLRRDAPPELVAVCAKAMHRDPMQRYASMSELAADLRAFQDTHVVGAYRTGPWATFVKWVARNRGLSASLAGMLVLAALAAGVVIALQRGAASNLRTLVDLGQAATIEARYHDLWPARPERLAAMGQWLAEATALVDRRTELQAAFEELRERALPLDPEAPAERRARQEQARRLHGIEELQAYYTAERERLQREGGLTVENETLDDVLVKLDYIAPVLQRAREWRLEHLTWTFADAQDQLQHDSLARLLPVIELCAGTPAMSGRDGWIDRARRGLAHARDPDAGLGETATAAWRAACASIADPTQCPAYGGLVLAPQFGLVPIGRDPRTGLWEFAHTLSGVPAQRDAHGELVLTEHTGIVLVLIPGGLSTVGAQATAPDELAFDPLARLDEAPPHPVRLEPFFLSKYELTQAQWERFTGRNPSEIGPATRPEIRASALHPLETVDWDTATRVLRELDLRLPSEAQWEYAARAGTATSWWTGADAGSLAGAANLLDPRTAESREVVLDAAEMRGAPADPFAAHAPVGSFRANAFGLFDVAGNVTEWCSDVGAFSYLNEVVMIASESTINGDGTRRLRGGSFVDPPARARSAARTQAGPGLENATLGLRPARLIEP